MEYAERVKLLKKQKTAPLCERCQRPITDAEFHYIKTRTRGEIWYHTECFYLEILGNVDAGKRK